MRPYVNTYFSHAAGAAPVALGYGLERRDEAVGVEGVVATVAQQHVVLVVALAAHAAHVRLDLEYIQKHKFTKTQIHTKTHKHKYRNTQTEPNTCTHMYTHMHTNTNAPIMQM